MDGGQSGLQADARAEVRFTFVASYVCAYTKSSVNGEHLFCTEQRLTSRSLTQAG